MGVKIDINKIKFKTQNQPLVAPIIHLGAGDKKPTWNTFSKDSAIQYDACYGRLNPIGGRFHSLRPVVSRLCFFSLPLHLILQSKISIIFYIHPLSVRILFLFIWFSNPKFQSYSTSTHFLFELNFLPWSAASDEPSFALSVLKKRRVLWYFQHLGTAPKKTVLTCVKVESNPAYVPDTSVRLLNSSLSLGIVRSKQAPCKKKMCSLVSTWNRTLLMFLIPLFVPWTQVCLWELSDRSPLLKKKMCSLVSTWNRTLLMFLIPLFVPWTQVCLWELSDRSPFRLLNWFFSLIESVDNTAMVFLVSFLFFLLSVDCISVPEVAGSNPQSNIKTNQSNYKKLKLKKNTQ